MWLLHAKVTATHKTDLFFFSLFFLGGGHTIEKRGGRVMSSMISSSVECKGAGCKTSPFRGSRKTVLKLCAWLQRFGSAVKNSTPAQGHGVGGWGQPLSEFIHQILMDLIEVLRLYKASWKQPAFMLKNNAWIQTVEEEYGLMCKFHVFRLTAGSCMLLRWKMKQELVPMKFFFGTRKVCQHKVISFFYLKEKCMRTIWNYDLTMVFFIIHVEYSSLFCQQTEIASRLPFGVYCMSCSLFLSSFQSL